jgi:hypothetical protein
LRTWGYSLYGLEQESGRTPLAARMGHPWPNPPRLSRSRGRQAGCDALGDRPTTGRRSGARRASPQGSREQRAVLTRGALPCANPEPGTSSVSRPESLVRTETSGTQELTRSEVPLNALDSRCQRCGVAIPEARVAAARRSHEESRWCSARCRVKASVAKKRQGG